MSNVTNPSPKPGRTELVRSRLANGVLTITIEGRFDFNRHQEFRRAYENMGKLSEVVLDLVSTEYLDSSALGMLLVLRETVGDAKVRIVNARPAVKRILEIANFQKLFQVA